MYFPDPSQFVDYLSSLKISRKQALYQLLREDIMARRLLNDERLPSIRQLSKTLQISRTTIQAAYDQLIFEGFIAARDRSGYFVIARVCDEKVPMLPDNFAHQFTDSLRESKGKTCSAELFDFSGSAIHLHSIDLSVWKKAIRRAWKQEDFFLRYSPSAGEVRLRSTLAKHLKNSLGLACEMEQIFIASGTQLLLERVIQFLRIKRNILHPEHFHAYFYAPVFPAARRVLTRQNLSLNLLLNQEVTSSQEKKQEVSDVLPPDSTDPRGVSLLYLQNRRLSLGSSSLTYNNRLRLQNWLQKNEHNYIVEDDYNGELQNCLRPVKPLAATAEKQVWYMGSVSKTLLPSVRISYLLVPTQEVSLFRAYWNEDHCTASVLEQQALAELIESGRWDRHLRRLRHDFAEVGKLVQSILPTLHLPLQKWSLEETALVLRLTLHLPHFPASSVGDRGADELKKLLAEKGIRIMTCQTAEEGGKILYELSFNFTSIASSRVAQGMRAFAQFWREL